jgi:hypothetical protein
MAGARWCAALRVDDAVAAARRRGGWVMTSRGRGGAGEGEGLLVVNAGSSSVKVRVFAIGDGGGVACRVRGMIDGVGVRPVLRATDAGGAVLVERGYAAG